MTDARQWLQLDPSDFDREAEQTINGVLFHVSVSPYDIPRAVRGHYDDEKDRFIIEFKYVSTEAVRAQRIDDHVVINLGENSGRLLSIEADVQAMEATAVLLRIDNLIGEADTSRMKPNYEVAKRIISDKAPLLWQGAARASSTLLAAH